MKAQKELDEAMPKLKKMDPDLFNPFSPIPYHNSVDVKYATEHIRMYHYLNENQINVENYPYKNYNFSYDHDNKMGYTYNWTSIHDKIDDNVHGKHVQHGNHH